MPLYEDDFSAFCKYDYIQFVIYLLKKSYGYGIFDLVNAVKKGNNEIFELLMKNKKVNLNEKKIFKCF